MKKLVILGESDSGKSTLACLIANVSGSTSFCYIEGTDIESELQAFASEKDRVFIFDEVMKKDLPVVIDLLGRDFLEYRPLFKTNSVKVSPLLVIVSNEIVREDLPTNAPDTTVITLKK